jgi:hypothetical protein
MTYGAEDIVGRDYQDFRHGKTIGEALKGIVRRRWHNNAAKLIEQQWGLDPKTAKNVVSSGNVSERTLSKAARAERWALWMALGEELFDETYDDYLRGVLDEFEQRKRRTAAHRDHIRSLEARAGSLLTALDRPQA